MSQITKMAAAMFTIVTKFYCVDVLTILFSRIFVHSRSAACKMQRVNHQVSLFPTTTKTAKTTDGIPVQQDALVSSQTRPCHAAPPCLNLSYLAQARCMRPPDNESCMRYWVWRTTEQIWLVWRTTKQIWLERHAAKL